MGKVRGASGRGQKGRRCQLNSTPNIYQAHLSSLEDRLDTGGIVRTKVNDKTSPAQHRINEPKPIADMILYLRRGRVSLSVTLCRVSIY